MNLFATAVEAVRREVAADRVVLVAHSMGAIVIREYAQNYPQHLAGLVAVDGPLEVRLLPVRTGGQGPMTMAMRERLIERMFSPQTPKSLGTEITKMMVSTSACTASGAGAAMFNYASQSARPINTPALTIYAGMPLFGQDHLIKEVFPKWKSIQIQEAGHFVMMEKPDRFNRLLAGFLNSRTDFRAEFSTTLAGG
jgi:pimeloyl-ACP methyl ester carboxylesterase